MLMDAAMVYPMAIPKRLPYWTTPHNITLNPPEKKHNRLLIKTLLLKIRVVSVFIVTEVVSDSVHVSIVSLAVNRVAGAVTRGEKIGGEISHGGKHHHHGGSSHPSQLRYCPSQRQNTRPNNPRYNMSTRRPNIPCFKNSKSKSKP